MAYQRSAWKESPLHISFFKRIYQWQDKKQFIHSVQVLPKRYALNLI